MMLLVMSDESCNILILACLQSDKRTNRSRHFVTEVTMYKEINKVRWSRLKYVFSKTIVFKNYR
jgi:hypothetical protein